MSKLLTKSGQVQKRWMTGMTRADSVNEEARTAEVEFISIDNGGTRYGQYGPEYDDYGQFVEELSLEKKHVRTARFDSGNSPLLKDHMQHSVDFVVGVIESAKFTKNGATAIVRFAKDEASDIIFQKVKDGILKNVSVGYRVFAMEEIARQKTNDGKTTIPVMRVTDYEPIEISMVPIGFDKGAQVRGEEADSKELNECSFLYRNHTENNCMTEEERKAQEAAEAADRQRKADEKRARDEAAATARKEGAEAEGKRQSEIRSRCAQAGLDQKTTDELCADVSLTAEAANKRIMDAWSEKGVKAPVASTIVVADGLDLGRSMAANLANRILPGEEAVRTEFSEGKGDYFNGCSMFDLGREMLHAHGIETRGIGRVQLAHKIIGFRADQVRHSGSGSMHTTFDFPSILEDIQNKFLRKRYEQSPRTFMPLVRERKVSDFKTISNVQIGEGQDLLEVPEGAEYKLATVGEGAEKYVLVKYGRIYKYSFEMLLNDDLDAFMRTIGFFGDASARLESDLFWAQLTDNPILQTDGKALFHADHNNLNIGGAAALGEAPLGQMRAATRKQVGLDGHILNLVNKHLIVPASLETGAEKLVTTITPATSGNVNVFSTTSKMNLIVEPRLDTSSTTAYYNSCDKNQIDLVEMARLEGEEAPSITTEAGFNSDSIKFKGRNFVAFKVLDFRGFQKNDGT